VAWRKGDRFTHRSFVDPEWTPGPGERYADGPRALCEVTRVAGGTVFYRFASGSGSWRMDLAQFEGLYGPGPGAS